MVLTGGCSSNDEPGSGNAKAKGEYKVDGTKVSLKYAYVYSDGDCYEYNFYDTDILKYLEKGIDPEDIDKEISCLYISYDIELMDVDEVIIDHKINGYRDTGISYSYYNSRGCSEYVDFSSKGSKVNASSKYIPLEGYNYGTNRWIYDCEGSFSVEGNPKDVTYLDDIYEYEAYSRGIEIIEITDQKQISFLKSLRMKHRNSSKIHK